MSKIKKYEKLLWKLGERGIYPNKKYDPDLDLLKWQTIEDVRVEEDSLFMVTDRYYITLNHQQECCESVYLEEVEEDLNLLKNNIIHYIEEVSNISENEDGIQQWTFYKIDTNKNSITLRWYGESNGYYSTSVDWTIYERKVLDYYFD